ncbi:D-glycero-beta-D-manno-heptose 1-phosphate adenylyltransferase [candidate division KSB1 bacterium]|nr:D-glycero-beta-D-manno-heptose 1-phosphate adenylyltransferase [candidate division KSB1 bacterium]
MNVLSRKEVADFCREAKRSGKTVVFTNGCFDIIHRGHIENLSEAAKLGDILIVGLNTDLSIKKLKGTGRPVMEENDRAIILASFEFVDAVCLFDEDTPKNLISEIQPDVLVKGGEYSVETIVGSDTVIAAGGKVIQIPMVKGKSTTDIIKRIKDLPI